MRSLFRFRVFIGLCSLALIAMMVPAIYAATQSTVLQPGNTLVVNCSTKLTGQVGANSATLVCAAAATPTRAVATATRAVATATRAVPTATRTAPTPTVGSLAGKPCPAALHDAITTIGPDGKRYPTWHPAVDPKTGCLFGHEHGADPRTSAADNTMPAFGYAAALHGMAEPHAGFKVFVMPRGWVEGGKTADADVRIVFHMGTSGVGRFTERFHSLEYDFVSPDGRYAHIYGMADTIGIAGSVCTRGTKPGKTLPEIACSDTYEIWPILFQIKHPDDLYTGVTETRLSITSNVAVFDPVLTRDPANNARVVYTQNVREPNNPVDPLSPQAAYLGCQREFYAGPNYWHNTNRVNVYYTDVFGNVQPGPGVGIIEQSVSTSTSDNGLQLKKRNDFCGNGIRPPN